MPRTRFLLCSINLEWRDTIGAIHLTPTPPDPAGEWVSVESCTTSGLVRPLRYSSDRNEHSSNEIGTSSYRTPTTGSRLGVRSNVARPSSLRRYSSSHRQMKNERMDMKSDSWTSSGQSVPADDSALARDPLSRSLSAALPSCREATPTTEASAAVATIHRLRMTLSSHPRPIISCATAFGHEATRARSTSVDRPLAPRSDIAGWTNPDGRGWDEKSVLGGPSTFIRTLV